MINRLSVFSYLNSSFSRFILVGVFSECFYLFLFALSIKFGYKSDTAILISAIPCILLNCYLHSRISFRRDFKIAFLVIYLLIQIICVIFTYLFSLILIYINIIPSYIAIITMLLWASLSYVMCRSFLYRRPKK